MSGEIITYSDAVMAPRFARFGVFVEACAEHYGLEANVKVNSFMLNSEISWRTTGPAEKVNAFRKKVEGLKRELP